jgi:hypothetical protein
MLKKLSRRIESLALLEKFQQHNSLVISLQNKDVTEKGGFQSN